MKKPAHFCECFVKKERLLVDKDLLLKYKNTYAIIKKTEGGFRVLNMKMATPKDAEMLGKLYYGCWMDTIPNIIPGEEFVPINEKDAISYFRKNHCCDTIKGYVGNDCVCLCYFGPCRDHDVMYESGEVYCIDVQKEHRLNGYGRRLIHEAIRSLRGQEYTQVVVWVLSNNANAIAFFEALGFKWDGSERTVKHGGNIFERRYFRII